MKFVLLCVLRNNHDERENVTNYSKSIHQFDNEIHPGIDRYANTQRGCENYKALSEMLARGSNCAEPYHYWGTDRPYGAAGKRDAKGARPLCTEPV